MYSACNALKCFLLPCVLCLSVSATLRAQAPTSTPEPAAAAPSEPSTAPATGNAEKPDDPSAKLAKEKLAPVLRTLPAGLDPNPPAPDDLKAQNLTWKGEYEATRDGQPVLGPDARPIPVLYSPKGKRVKSKVKPLHTHDLTVVAGTLTVDGWTGKARLNYDIPGQDFLYFSAPTFGTVILSQTAFPGSREQKLSLDGKTLTVHVNDHDVQLASDKPLAGKKPESIWMRIDPDFHQDARYPVMGFGPVSKPPYAWPAAKLAESKGAKGAPPLPASMMPAVVTPVCIAQPAKPCAPAANSRTVAVPTQTATSPAVPSHAQ